MGGAREVVSYCRICEALCGIVATVEDGQVIKIKGDDQHPVSKGYLCPKGSAMAKVVSDPDRVVTPLRRSGGPGEFRPVSWDEALDDIAGRLNGIRQRFGPQAIAMYFGNPGGFSLGALFWAKGLMDAIGSRNFYSAAPQDTFGRHAASHHLYKAALRFPLPDIPRTDFLLCLGANPLVSHGSLVNLPRIREEMQNIVTRGGRVVVVDPVRTKTAEAFEHLPIRPATDAWLLAAMINVVFSEGLDDKERTAATAQGAPALMAAVAPVTPALAERATGVPAEQIVALARAFAGAKSACAYSRVGLNRNPQATVASFLLDALNVITGNFDVEGGMIFGDSPFDFVGLAGKFGMMTFGAHRSRVSGLGEIAGLMPWVLPEEITTPGEGQVRALLVVAGNPVLSAPDGDALERGLGQLDLHLSLDLYMNETNRHADYILPVANFLERADFPAIWLCGMPRPWLQMTPAVVDPPAGVREDWEVLDEIVGRMGLGGPFSQRSVRLVAKGLRRFGIRITPTLMANALLKAGRSKWTLGKLERHPHGVVERPHARVGSAAKKVFHPGGLVNLGPQPVLEAIGQLAEPPAPLPEGALELVGRRELRSINSWLHNVRTVRDDAGPTLWLNPVDAESRHLVSGDEALLTGPSNTITVEVEVTDAVPRGTVSYPHGWGHREAGWKTANQWGGANVNRILSTATSAKDPLSGASHLDGVTVRLDRLEAMRARLEQISTEC